MSVLIHGLEMPQEGFVEVLIRDDGTVQQTGQSYRIDGTDYYTPYVGEMPVMYKAIPVPPHGRLGDLDEAEKKIVRLFNYSADGYSQDNVDGYEDGLIDAQNAVRNIPTILPASEVE